MTTYTWGRLDQTRTYPDIELVMSVKWTSKMPWYQCYRCDVGPILKRYSVVTVDNIVSDICKKCLGELGLLQSRYREYILVSYPDEKIKIYQLRGLPHYIRIYYKTSGCVKI